jgi:hypothetical protein
MEKTKIGLIEETQSTIASTSVDDAFDPNRLRLSQDFQSMVDVRKALVTVPVRKPDRQWFVRTRPEEDWRLETAVLEVKEERATFLVDRSLWPELPGEITPKVLFTAINRAGVLFLWPVRLPNPDGRNDEWSRSALEAAQLGMKRWVRVAANMSLGAYEVFEAAANLPEPVWPEELGFKKVIEVAFRDRFIRSLDHPVIRRLRGEL